MIAVLVVGAVLAGCSATATATSGATPGPVNPSASTSAPSATPSAAPTFVAGGSADDNRAFFDYTNSTLFASNGSANGRTIIDTLVAAGFDKASMQVTPDKTSINGTVDSILFSVKLGGECLLGQHGGGGYSSAVEAALKNGSCLIGKTRPIDW
jgi:hypothetical protein